MSFISISKLMAVVWLAVVLGNLKHNNSPFFDKALVQMSIVFFLLWVPSLVSVLFSRGMTQRMARDYGSQIQLSMVSLVLWIGYLLLGCSFLFNWSIY